MTRFAWAAVASAFLSHAAWAATPAATVSLDRRAFIPAKVTVRVGETVLWINGSDMKHTVTADPSLARIATSAFLPQGAKPFNSGILEKGQSFSHRFTVPGTYRYFCMPHERFGMVGEVEVVKGP